MPFRVLVGLILCNAIWAANPMMAKILLAAFRPAHVAWLRYFSATLAFLLFVAASGFLRARASGIFRARVPAAPLRGFFARARTSRDLFLVVAVGFSAFCFAPLVGLFGLNQTGAVDNALLIALEPLVTTLLAILFLGERLSLRQVLSFAAALFGFGMLSGLVLTPPSRWFHEPSIVGNLILVVSLAGEAGYSIFARRLAGRYPMSEVFGSSLLWGFAILSLLVTLVAGPGAWRELASGLTQLDARGWMAMLWLGPLGSTLTYLIWLIALESTDVSSAALTLFVQPIVGALLGAAVLGESLTPLKWIGGGVILVAVGLLTPRRQNS